MRFLHTLAAALAVSCAVGVPACSPDATRERAHRTSSAIQGGVEDGTHTFAVAVYDRNDTCSGTLIAPNLVLSARHCFAPTPNEVIDCKVEKFGKSPAATTFQVTTDRTTRGAKSVFRGARLFEPADPMFCGNDIALLMLDRNVSPDVATPATPAIDPPMSDHTRYGTRIAAVGYGITGPGQTDEGTRRTRENIPLRCVPGDPTNDCKPSTYDMTAREFLAGDGLCTGDSGSSAYDQQSFTDGRPVTFGVLSRASETGSRCTDAIYTRTDAFRDFIVGAAIEAAAAGGYPRPAWAGEDAGDDAGTPASDDASADAGAAAGAAPDPGRRGCSVGPDLPAANAGRGPAWSVLALTALGLVRRRRRYGRRSERNTISPPS